MGGKTPLIIFYLDSRILNIILYICKTFKTYNYGTLF
jgi:hypothetical protein